ncbi:unnamed protein product [Paramecium primaurelia]|uniref:Uncharacterized protein n=1 Tax=Paramecium primaurelia TaxID=5886 RepID=A0A8S1QED7_PARPR|nr:unnamed protein product [Paramecium primaurelia]
MRTKSHNKAKSLHTVQEVSNTKTFFISRITQRSFIKSIVPPLSLPQVPQIQVPAPLTGRVVARKVIKATQLKTQESVPDSEIKQQQSIFKLVASAEFKNIITEEKSKKEDDKNFTLDGPLEFKKDWRSKIFTKNPNMENSYSQIDDNMNIQMFMKKIRQIITTSHIQHNDFHTNENSFLSDKFKTQMTSPRFTFTNHLSTIQFQNQPTQLQKAGTIVSQVLEAIEEKKAEIQPIPQNNRRKLTISVFNPENQVGVFSFSIPDYGQRLQEQDEIQEYTDKPKHVLKQALQFISSQPKKMTTKFSKSILKIVGITEEENQQEDVHQYYNIQKTRRFMKMYLQNKMSRTFTKLEENILLHLQLIQEKRGSISFSKPYESQQSSRVYSWCTNPANSNHESLSNPTFQIEIESNRFLLTQIYQCDYSFDNSEQDCQSFSSENQFSDMLECSSQIKITNLTNHIQFIINSLDCVDRNMMLHDPDFLNDNKIGHDQINPALDGQIIRNINSLVRFLKKKDQSRVSKFMFLQFNDILTGEFEDLHEINNLTTDYGLIEVESEDQHQPRQSTIKIDIAKMFIKAAKPIQKKKSNQDQSPSSERSNKKNNSKIISSPRHQTVIQPNKPVKQLLEATSSQTSVLRRRSDSPQEENSIKENSNTNTTQSNKMKATTQTIQNTTAPISQKEDLIKPNATKSQERRNAVMISSMSKHSLQMRTQITEARRRQSIPVMEMVKLLIEEQKLSELEEVFANNPNLPINEKLKDGNTFLIVAAQTGNVEIVELLLHKGAFVNVQNNYGDTALHKAIAYNYFNIADILISQGAQNLRNDDGLTPWQFVQ